MEKEWHKPNDGTQDLDFIEIEGNQPKIQQQAARAQTPEAKGRQDARKVEDRFQGLSEQINELSRLMSLKTERMSIKIKLIEERHQTFVEDFQQRMTAVNVKMSDKPRMDMKIEELIERQNQAVRTFENRMTQLKRVVENQEAELYKVMNELQEARKEIARLKRT